MKVYALYFSPTGGTKKVIETILTVWECEKVEIDLADRKQDLSQIVLGEEDICVVAVPSFSGRVPQFIIPKLKQLHGEGRKAMLITTYGNRAFDDTLLELQDTMKEAGVFCACGVAAVTEHSVMPKYGKGRPDAADLQELREFADTCKQVMEQTKEEVQMPGNRPYREYISIPIKPKANKNCMECGLCVEKCPVQAISENNMKNTDIEKCISCLQCVSICPKNARGISSIMRKAAEVKMKKVCGGRKENRVFLPAK